ncbi:MAG: calcium-binding protein [Pseudomonadota bacterium]
MANRIYLTEEADIYHGNNDFDLIFGYGGNDRLFGWGGNDWLLGGEGNDQLTGGEGDDWHWGQGGDDTIYGGDGSDKIIGGEGNDWITYFESGGSVEVNLREGKGFGGHAEGDTYTDVEIAVGSDFSDKLYGSDFADNSLYGLKGDDYFYGSLGADLISGGEGTDMVSYYLSESNVVIDLGTNANFGGHAHGDKLYSIERVRGSDFSDDLTGDSDANWLSGRDGNDRIAGLDNDDKLYGGSDDDQLYGGDGADSLYGGSDDDLLAGGAGADYMDGHSGIDTVGYDYGEYGERLIDAEAVYVDLALGRGFGGHAEGDVYRNIENATGTWFGDDKLYGNTGNNFLDGSGGEDDLRGFAGDDELDGGSSDDTLEGGGGADILNGSLGSDTFVYTRASDSREGSMDTIVNWDNDPGGWFGVGREIDIFDFRLIDGNSQMQGNQTLEWINEQSFSAAGQVREVRGGAVTYIEANLDNDLSDTEMVIKVDVPHNFDAGDFMF